MKENFQKAGAQILEGPPLNREGRRWDFPVFRGIGISASGEKGRGGEK